MPLRAALVGCGRIGSQMADDPLLAGDVFTHADAYVRSPATELVAVCDLDPLLAAQCAQRWGVDQVFSDPAQMQSEIAPDLVSICTPVHTHESVAHQLLKAASPPRGILCEKPIATSLEAARKIAELACERRVMLAVSYMRRHAPNLKALRDFLSSGALGGVQSAAGWYTKGVLHNGSHWFDLLRMLVGEVDWVEAHDILAEGGADPTLDVLLGLRQGGLASLRAARDNRFTLFEMELICERGRIRITDSGHDIAVERAVVSPRYTGYVELVPDELDFGDRRNQMLYAVDDLADAVVQQRQPACTGADGIAALQIATAAFSSARSQSIVRIA
jgi:predicted dehydrogenase